jgi:peroxiredoxin
MEGDEEKVESLRKAYVALDEKKSDKVKEAIDNMGNSLAALYAVNFLDPEKDFPFLDKLAQKVDQGMPNSKYAQEFVASVNGMRTLAIGEMAPDIALPNPDGDVVALSSLRGKYVLIDFWAAWCRPCRIENPNVVRMYHKYNEKGFEVFGVSLDRNKKDWVEAIEADGLVWTQVSDLQYFNSAAASLYNIQAIPATYLIDPDGKIIAKNLRGAALEEKLAEVLL